MFWKENRRFSKEKKKNTRKLSKAKKLLDEHYQPMEYIINTDPCGQPIAILSIVWAEDMSQVLQSYGYTFVNEKLDREK